MIEVVDGYVVYDVFILRDIEHHYREAAAVGAVEDLVVTAEDLVAAAVDLVATAVDLVVTAVVGQAEVLGVEIEAEEEGDEARGQAVSHSLKAKRLPFD